MQALRVLAEEIINKNRVNHQCILEAWTQTAVSSQCSWVLLHHCIASGPENEVSVMKCEQRMLGISLQFRGFCNLFENIAHAVKNISALSHSLSSIDVEFVVHSFKNYDSRPLLLGFPND